MKKKPPNRCKYPGNSAGQRKAPKPKAGQKTVDVPYATSNSSVHLSAPVTVSKAPWE